MLVIKTLQSVAESVQDQQGCFELYGFDILLDDTCKPWLLEVNLSPACAERTDWLKDMLDSMIEGLLRIVIDKEKKEPLYGKNLDLLRWTKAGTFEWVLLFKEEVTENEGFNRNLNLEIVGEKFNVRRERFLERALSKEQAAFVIQKTARGYFSRLRTNQHCVVIQRALRRMLVSKLLVSQT